MGTCGPIFQFLNQFVVVVVVKLTFVCVYIYIRKQDIEMCKHLFARGDRNKDGKVDAVELKQLLGELGENVSEGNVKELLKEIDTDMDGVSFIFCSI